MSYLSRLCFSLVAVATLLVFLLVLLARITGLGPHPRQVSYEPLDGVIHLTAGTPSHQIVADYVETLRRDAGRQAAPVSDLPYPRAQIRDAILAAPVWAKDYESPRGIAGFGALLVELENFVADPSESRAIWDSQCNVIAQMGPQYRYITYVGERPIPIGEAAEALNQMLGAREAQYFGFLAVPMFMGFLGWRVLTQLIRKLRRRPLDRWRTAGFVLFVVLGLMIGAVGYPLAWLHGLVDSFAAGSRVGEIATFFVMVLVLLVPVLVSSVLFDLLVFPGIHLRGFERSGSNPS